MIDERFQKQVLACMLRVPQYNNVARQYLVPSYFEGTTLNNLGKIIIDYSKMYETCMGDYEFSRILTKLIKGKLLKEGDLSHYLKAYKELGAIDVSGWKMNLEEVITFIKHSETKMLINEAVSKFLPKEDFKSIEDRMQKIARISILNEVVPYDYFASDKIAERALIRKEEAVDRRLGISTGIKRMDEVLYRGGFWEKELYIFMAGPKRGKTMALLWFVNFAAITGGTVLHFTCEVSRRVCEDRMDAMNSDTEFKNLLERASHVEEALKRKGAKGKAFIYEYPTKSLTVAEIENQIERLQTVHGIKVDMISVDYLDILKPAHRKEHGWEEQGSIAEDLRGVACKYCIPVITATQVNRNGAGKMLVKGSDTAGNYEKIMVADQVVTFSATDDELKKRQLRIHFSESRNNPMATIVVSTAYHFGKFYDGFVTEEL